MELQPLTKAELPWLTTFLRERWCSELIIVHNKTFQPQHLNGIKAIEDDRVVGLATYVFSQSYAELVSLDSLQPGKGIGTALVQAVIELARSAGKKELRLTTTNDNLNALKLYQRLGFRLKHLRVGAVDKSRLLKPEIPLLGEFDIPLHDELDLSLALASI